jgi:hypothetical protein
VSVREWFTPRQLPSLDEAGGVVTCDVCKGQLVGGDEAGVLVLGEPAQLTVGGHVWCIRRVISQAGVRESRAPGRRRLEGPHSRGRGRLQGRRNGASRREPVGPAGGPDSGYLNCEAHGWAVSPGG